MKNGLKIDLRLATDEDGDAVVALVEHCFAQYSGCVVDPHSERPLLARPASAYLAKGGLFWVAEHAGRVVGCIGFAPAAGDQPAELQKLYVHGSMRKQGLGSHLCALVEAEARRNGAAALQLWSDTRFVDAHRLYRKLGYQQGDDTRALHDASNSVEYYFRKRLME